MKFHEHVLLSLLLLVLYPVFGINVFVIMLSSVLIDIDQLHLIIKKKIFSLKKIKSYADEYYKGNKKNIWKGKLFLFHLVEFNFLLVGLSFVYPFLWLVSIGFIFHILTDAIYYSVRGLPVTRWLFLSNYLREK